MKAIMKNVKTHPTPKFDVTKLYLYKLNFSLKTVNRKLTYIKHIYINILKTYVHIYVLYIYNIYTYIYVIYITYIHMYIGETISKR